MMTDVTLWQYPEYVVLGLMTRRGSDETERYVTEEAIY